MSMLPLEICFLIIDAIGRHRRAGFWDDKPTAGKCIDTLTACSLVCRAWYHHTITHLWSSLVIVARLPLKGDTDSRFIVRRSWREYGRDHREGSVPLADVLDIFQSNPRLMASVRHLFLSFPWPKERNAVMATPELVAFFRALAPLPRFSWMAEEVEDLTIFSTSFENHLLGQIVGPFCHSSTLTTFTFRGPVFLFDTLKNMPNLKDVSFSNVAECSSPHSSLQTLAPWALPFRLRKARFLGAECVYRHLIHFEDIFSQLEHLVVEIGDWGDDEEEKLAALVCLPMCKLRTLNIEVTNSQLFARSLIQRGSPLDFLRTVESCSIRITDLSELVTSRHLTWLLDILEEVPKGILGKLKCFNLHLLFVKAPLFDIFFDRKNHAWCTAKHLLGPEIAPCLKSFSITTTWALSRNGDLKRDRENGVEERLASRCLEMLEECAPRWEDDARDVERILKVQGPLYVSD